MRKVPFFLLLASCFLLQVSPASASDITSGSFEILSPVFNAFGFSSSNSFRLTGSVGQPAIGTSNSSSFQLTSGSQAFSASSAGGGGAPTPTPTPTPTGGGGPIINYFKKLFGNLIRPCTGGDLDCDGHVDILDVGILMYWWGRPLEQPAFTAALAQVVGLGRPTPDFNKDNEVDIFDLSVLLSYWTG